MKQAKNGGMVKRRDPWRDIKNHLVAQPQEILIDLLLEVAQRDDRLYRSLLLKAQRSGDAHDLVKSYQMVIDAATYIHDFVDWREASPFAGNIELIVESLAELLTTDTVTSLVELAEYAIERVENALEQIAKASGTIEELVGIKSRDLSSAYRYLEIAQIYAKASQPEFERKRNDEALELVWIQFEERPILEHYIKLHDIAVTLDAWASQRVRALSKVDEITAREVARTNQWKSTSSTLNHSLRSHYTAASFQRSSIISCSLSASNHLFQAFPDMSPQL